MYCITLRVPDPLQARTRGSTDPRAPAARAHPLPAPASRLPPPAASRPLPARRPPPVPAAGIRSSRFVGMHITTNTDRAMIFWVHVEL